ncbi:hypothetical protein KVR01_009701 [Diaporthe batatas]|uniref:uncharacterized protein n=1 Tax=Diaporthe batatas TaxID=748121 RepID=UPI001D041E52|nr:uncharacterized protein KVR01_009701 [Diaporthe batatas]KAG8160165.1 hypothetical protein KVR01_009701 [Diaporthe batatas]
MASDVQAAVLGGVEGAARDNCAFHKCWNFCGYFFLLFLPGSAWVGAFPLGPAGLQDRGSSPTISCSTTQSWFLGRKQFHGTFAVLSGLGALLPLLGRLPPLRLSFYSSQFRQHHPHPSAPPVPGRFTMAILCCCGHLRSRKQTRGEEDVDLPVPPPPAKLPAAVLHPLAISPGSTLARSSLTNPLPGAATDALVHLGELVVEESDEDDVDEDLAHDSRNRSTSTLQAVKSCIRRHLSEDSLQRQGETEEQMAHRAEVKRLMRKRIQEELQSETDHAQSRPSTPQRHGPGPATLSGNGPRDTIEFSVDESQKFKDLTPVGAADMTEEDGVQQRPISKSSFRLPSKQTSVKENRRPTSIAASEPEWIDAESRASQIDCHLGIRERNSLPDIPNSPVLLPIPGSALHDASSLASWRLSLTADKLADLFTPDKTLTLFRPLASTPGNRSTADLKDDVSLSRPRSKSSPLGVQDSNTRPRTHSRQISLDSTLCNRIPASKSLIRDESPVGLWLRTQSMGFRPCTTPPPQSEVRSESHNQNPQRVSHFDVADIQIPITPTGLSRVRCSDSSRPLSLPGSPSHSSRCSLDPARQSLQIATHTTSRVKNPEQAVEGQASHTYGIPSAMISNTKLVSLGSNLQQSSFIPSAIDDAHTQVGETMPSHPCRRGLGGLRMPSFKWAGIADGAQHVPERDRTVTPPCGGSTTFFTSIDPRRVTIEPGSETSSFLRREAELQHVEERFRDSHLRKGSFSLAESRFHEVFDQDGASSSNRRLSLLSRLHFNVTKRGKVSVIETLDGNDSGHTLAHIRTSPTSVPQHKVSEQTSVDDGHLQVPRVFRGKGRVKTKETGHILATSSANTRRLRGFSSSKEGDDTAELWKRAVRAESESRSPRGSVSSNMPALCVSPEASSHSEILKAPQPSGAASLSSSRSDLHSPLCKAPPGHDNEAALSEALRRSSTILQDWANQLENRELESQTKGECCASQPRSRFKTSIPPASWAKYPSYNRNERNASAGADDKVISRDFAVKNISSSGNVAWATDKTEDRPPSQKGIGRTFSDKFSQTFKSRLIKLIPGRSRTPSRDRSMRGVRRSSIQIAGDLEYPELEILPKTGGYRDLRALEFEIHEMKGIAHTKIPLANEEPDVSQVKASLAEHMTTAMSQHDGSSGLAPSDASETGSFIEEKASLVQLQCPETPALQIRYPETTRTKESTGSTVERYATPLSHLSSSGHEASSSATPELIIKLLPSAHSSSSLKSARSLMRRASLRTAPCNETCTFSTHHWQSGDDHGRRSVPMLSARASG